MNGTLKRLKKEVKQHAKIVHRKSRNSWESSTMTINEAYFSTTNMDRVTRIFVAMKTR